MMIFYGSRKTCSQFCEIAGGFQVIIGTVPTVLSGAQAGTPDIYIATYALYKS